MTNLRLVDNSMRDLADRAGQYVLAWDDLQAARLLRDLDPSRDHQLAFLTARAAFLATWAAHAQPRQTDSPDPSGVACAIMRNSNRRYDHA